MTGRFAYSAGENEKGIYNQPILDNQPKLDRGVCLEFDHLSLRREKGERTNQATDGPTDSDVYISEITFYRSFEDFFLNTTSPSFPNDSRL